jgi:hypothetical protein
MTMRPAASGNSCDQSGERTRWDENIAWLAMSLGRKGDETPEETIRRYLSSTFFKHHLQIYKKRPLYWLFSSGKQKAFECLVYLHRYNQSTLARMRTTYVVPLTSKITGRIDLLQRDFRCRRLGRGPEQTPKADRDVAQEAGRATCLRREAAPLR